MLLKNIEKDFPFISVVTYGGNEYVGIIANQDAVHNKYVHVYSTQNGYRQKAFP